MPASATGPRLALLLLFLVAACGGPPYFPLSEFWRYLPSQPVLDPDSAAYIADLGASHKGGRFFINVSQYNVPIARGGAPVDVTLTSPFSDGVLRGVPIPDSAQPANGSDGHLVVLGGGVSYELYQARRTGSGWQATSAVRFDLGGDGVNRQRSGVRASSLSLLLGLLTYDEIRGGGPIEHALAFAFDTPNARFFTPPAASSDGNRAGRPASLPMGARLQLDPALDVRSLGLSPVGVRIAEAMQRYGLICVDSSADSSLFAEALGEGRSWDGLLGYDEVQRIPVERLRVLLLPQKIPIP